MDSQLKEKSDLKIIFCNESVSQSILTDIVTFGILTVLLFVNYNCLGDSTLVLLLIIFIFFVQILVYRNKKTKKMTPEEALEYLLSKRRRKNDTG